MTQPSRPTPNVSGTLGGDSNRPWVTLRSMHFPLIGLIGRLSTWLSAIDDGLEIVATPDELAIRVQPKDNTERSRPELFIAVRRLAATQEGWRVKWQAD